MGGGNSLMPYTIHGREGVNVIVDRLTGKQIPEVYKLIRRIINGRKSAVSSIEFRNENAFHEFLAATTAAFAVKETKTERIVGFCNISPQTFCRSAVPVSSRGYAIFDPEVRGRNIFAELSQLFVACSMAAGYLGSLSNVPQKFGSTTVQSILIGRFVTCVIPEGVHLLQTGWCDDLLMYVDFVQQFPHLSDTKLHLNEEEVVSRAKKASSPDGFDRVSCDLDIKVTVSLKGRRDASIRLAQGEEEIIEVYKMFGNAANTADGFGVDEFPSLHIFRMTYMAGRSLHVIHDKDRKTLMGAVVVGRSHLTRGNPRLAMMYIYILPSYRRHGYGALIEQRVAEYLKTRGYVGVLTDLLMTSRSFYRFAARAGYVNIGTVPRSCYVTKQGWTDAAVLYKKFDQPLTKSWLNDFSKTIQLKGRL